MSRAELEALFQQWLHEHIGLVWRVARAYANSLHDQEDLRQEILINLWKSLPRFRGESRESTWIYRVAFNTALVWRRGEHRRARQKKSSLEIAASTLAQPASGNDETTELIDQLYAAIRRLSELDASLALMHLDGLGYREISEVLGISENHVGVRLTRIRRQLAELLEVNSK